MQGDKLPEGVNEVTTRAVRWLHYCSGAETTTGCSQMCGHNLQIKREALPFPRPTVISVRREGGGRKSCTEL